MKVVGVYHQTRDSPAAFGFMGRNLRSFPATREVSFTNKFIERNSKIGFELPYTEKDFADPEVKTWLKTAPDLRFNKAVLLYAKRKNASVVHVENEGLPRLLHDIVGATLSSSVKKDVVPDKYAKHLDILFSEARKTPGFNANEFCSTFQVFRSVLMHEKALKEGCQTLVMGASHARHLQQLGYENEYHYSPITSKNVENADYSNEITAYKKYAPAFRQALQRISKLRG